MCPLHLGRSVSFDPRVQNSLSKPSEPSPRLKLPMRRGVSAVEKALEAPSGKGGSHGNCQEVGNLARGQEPILRVHGK